MENENLKKKAVDQVSVIVCPCESEAVDELHNNILTMTDEEKLAIAKKHNLEVWSLPKFQYQLNNDFLDTENTFYYFVG